MNYEFHVGDYVETVDGEVGYISDICDCDKCKECGWLEPHVVFSNGEEDYISNYDVKCISDRFARIGAYDFTKKEKKKIEMIQHNNNEINKNLPVGQSLCMLKDKINELVDAVNKLMEDKE